MYIHVYLHFFSIQFEVGRKDSRHLSQQIRQSKSIYHLKYRSLWLPRHAIGMRVAHSITHFYRLIRVYMYM